MHAASITGSVDIGVVRTAILDGEARAEVYRCGSSFSGLEHGGGEGDELGFCCQALAQRWFIVAEKLGGNRFFFFRVFKSDPATRQAQGGDVRRPFIHSPVIDPHVFGSFCRLLICLLLF